MVDLKDVVSTGILVVGLSACNMLSEKPSQNNPASAPKPQAPAHFIEGSDSGVPYRIWKINPDSYLITSEYSGNSNRTNVLGAGLSRIRQEGCEIERVEQGYYTLVAHIRNGTTCPLNLT